MWKDLLKPDNFKLDLSTVFLIVSNLIPLFGAIYLGWNVGAIIVLYWLENVVIGIFNVIKIMSLPAHRAAKIGSSTFFSVHYGIFTLVHGVFVFTMFEGASLDEVWGGGNGMFWAALGLMLSHSLSLLVNFYGKQEYKTSNVGRQMFAPYGRVVVLHMVIIFGGMLVQSLGSPLPALIIMIVLKILIDLGLHNVSHKIAQTTPAP